MASTNLGKIADIITGPFGSMLHKSDYRDTGTPVIMPQDIGDRTLSLESIARIGNEDVARLARYATIENDIVYARRGDVEKHAYITSEQAGALCGTGCLRVRVNEQLADPLFVSFYLNRPESKTWIRLHAVGSNMPNINTDILSELPLELPGLDTQRQVGNLLRCIDSKIANNKKLMQELEETARLIYDYWFTQYDYPDENGRPYQSSDGKMTWNDILKREIPEGWSAGSLASLGEIISGATPSTSDAANYADTGIAWITPNDLSDSDGRMHIGHGERDISKKGLQSCSAQLMPIGSVIMSSRAPIGYLAVATQQCCTNQGCKSLIPNMGYGTYFVYLTMKRRMLIIKAQGVGTTFTEVSKETLSAIPLELPPASIASRFEKVVLPLCNQIKTLEMQCDELSSLRDWLLPMLMNGQATITG